MDGSGLATLTDPSNQQAVPTVTNFHSGQDTITEEIAAAEKKLERVQSCLPEPVVTPSPFAKKSGNGFSENDAQNEQRHLLSSLEYQHTMNMDLQRRMDRERESARKIVEGLHRDKEMLQDLVTKQSIRHTQQNEVDSMPPIPHPNFTHAPNIVAKFSVAERELRRWQERAKREECEKDELRHQLQDTLGALGRAERTIGSLRAELLFMRGDKKSDRGAPLAENQPSVSRSLKDSDMTHSVLLGGELRNWEERHRHLVDVLQAERERHAALSLHNQDVAQRYEERLRITCQDYERVIAERDEQMIQLKRNYIEHQDVMQRRILELTSRVQLYENTVQMLRSTIREVGNTNARMRLKLDLDHHHDQQEKLLSGRIDSRNKDMLLRGNTDSRTTPHLKETCIWDLESEAQSPLYQCKSHKLVQPCIVHPLHESLMKGYQALTELLESD